RSFFFFQHAVTTEISTLSLHDALPIYRRGEDRWPGGAGRARAPLSGATGPAIARGVSRRRGALPGMRSLEERDTDRFRRREADGDRKSTRLNSSHRTISYAVFCLKKKK